MSKSRLEAFSDGVIAILITIMVLELHPPHADDPRALVPLWHSLLSYVLSFIYIGIYWNNHHHIFHAADRVTGMTLWANLHLLFWLSLIPFVTAWLGQSHFGAWPVAAYGLVLFLAALAWDLERRILLRSHDPHSPLARAMTRGYKEILSLLLYLAAIALAFFVPILSCLIYFAVAALWFVPDRRIERALRARPPIPPR